MSQGLEGGSGGAVGRSSWAWDSGAGSRLGIPRAQPGPGQVGGRAHLLPWLWRAEGLGQPHTPALDLLRVRARETGVQAPQASWVQEAQPCEAPEGRRGPRWGRLKAAIWGTFHGGRRLLCSLTVARTRRRRAQPSWGTHCMAVESVRPPRTPTDMDLGGGRQELLRMGPVGNKQGPG